jgi:hypothetical protein
MPGISLLALASVAPCHWKAIFERVGGREVKLMRGFVLLNMVMSMGYPQRAPVEVHQREQG